MTDPNLRLVCEVAAAWAGEYGFTEPDRARAVILAVYSVDPDALEPRDRHWAASQTTPCPICVYYGKTCDHGPRCDYPQAR